MEQLISLDIPARGEYVVLCRLALTGLLRDRGFSEDAVADLKLAITEACTNSIRHGFDDNRTEPARPANDPLPTEGGMGIAIIQAVVDEFRIERPQQGGTRLVLTKLCDS